MPREQKSRDSDDSRIQEFGQMSSQAGRTAAISAQRMSE